MSAEPNPTLAVTLEHVEELSRGLGETGNVLPLRRRARELVTPLVLPDRARHLWRYTNPERFVPVADPTALAPVAIAHEWPREDHLSAAALVAGGALRMIDIDDAARRAGVVVEDLHRAATDGLLGSLVPPEYGFVEAINTASWHGGVLVRVPAGVELEHPIRVRFVASAEPVSVPRVLVVAGAGSAFEILEGHVGGGVPTQVLGVTEIVAGPDSRVRFSLVQRWDTGVTGHLTARARLERGAHFQMSLASFGGSLYKVDVGAILAGEGAQAEMFGVAMGGEKQHMDHHTEHLHEAGKTHSNLDFKVALTGAARSAYTGMIRIARDAPGSEAYQVNRNLLLSEDARAESIPELEILTDDVRCSHGATVAPLDDEQVFYLKSRGLPHSQAMRLIVYGFLDQTLQRLPAKTRERIEALVASRLHEG
jgi:Fe-S cluster assembly protein SufD